MASFMNAELINALDSDILGPFVGHVTPYVTPACLSISELVHAPGKDLILALAIAHEIGGRIAGSLSQSRSPKKDPPYYQVTSKYSFGAAAFGGTAGACRLLKMDTAKITHALGMTGITVPVPGMMHFHQTSSPSPMAKYNSWPGWVAQIPTWAALLANKGFTSDPSILDGEWGFYRMYGSEFFKEEAIFNQLGNKWDVLDVEFKPYPCCRCQHAAIDGINKPESCVNRVFK
jgi:2-methylcitrate dehydratase PrpD